VEARPIRSSVYIPATKHARNGRSFEL
jgi:hypothetical protein